MKPRFSGFVAIDWSGAKGTKHAGIAVGYCDPGNCAPQLIAPPIGRFWSRTAVADWLLEQDKDLLIGFDFSFAPPFTDKGTYLPGERAFNTAKAFWAYVDNCCSDEDLGAASFLESTHRRHFYFGAADGRKADYMRLRACEAHYNAQGGGKPSTVFDAIGASQVAKASFAGMRLLHKVNSVVPTWPFDPLPENGPVILEIYTQIAARAAGLPKGRSKIRDASGLDKALTALNSQPHVQLDRYTDHATDALVTAAWLRFSAENEVLWRPEPLTPKIASTEGWTFGVV